MELLKQGLHPVTNEKFIKLGIPAVLIGQVIGDAPLSAGFHAVDGQWSKATYPSINAIPTTPNGEWVDYCGAVDLRPAHYNLSGNNVPMTRQEIWDLVNAGALLGLAMFFRHPGFDGTPLSWPEHIHLVDAGVKLKPQLSEQVHDFRIGCNGLADHGPYSFYKCSMFASFQIHTLWNIANADNGHKE